MNEKQALGMTMQINQEFINNLAEQIVSESLMATLNGSDKFVKQIIHDILTVKVDKSNGKPTDWNGIPYVNWLINNVIREEVKGTVEEILDERRPEIRKAIRSELMKKDTIDRFLNAFTDSVVGSVNHPYMASIDVRFEETKE